jgi:hypothetical protein
MRKTMAVMLMLVTTAFLLNAQTGVQGKSGSGTKGTTVQTQAKFTCPMHADVKADKAGKCPKCGMELTKAVQKTSCCGEGMAKKEECRTKDCQDGGCKKEGGNGCCGGGAAEPKK